MSKIKVKDIEITVIESNGQDYISLTDMVKNLDGDQLIKNWLRNKNTIEFLGVWERLNNENFNMVDFDLIKIDAGTNRFLMSVNQWVERTSAIGIVAKAGRYGGTYAHKDIAFEFGTWISPEFKLILIKEFQRLKDNENGAKNLQWDYRRFLSKVNYKVHTDSIQSNIIPIKHLPKDKEWVVYADEADMLNVVLFGQTAKQWKENNPQLVLQGRNMRDYGDLHQLTVLSNLESYNAILINENIPQPERFVKLRNAAISQLASLKGQPHILSEIQSPFIVTTTTNQVSNFDIQLKGLLNVSPPNKGKK